MERNGPRRAGRSDDLCKGEGPLRGGAVGDDGEVGAAAAVDPAPDGGGARVDGVGRVGRGCAAARWDRVGEG